MAYQDVAKNIIKESIKTAVYIDENALEAYEKMPETPSAEQALSVELTKKLRESNIDLTVFKYEAQKYKDQKNYVFANKDLVLLDWELDGEGGGGLSALKILQEIVSSFKNIHFCVIYTREENIDGILTDIRCFFSGATQQWVTSEKENLALFDKAPKESDAQLLLNIAGSEDLNVRRLWAELYAANPELKKVAYNEPLKYATCILNKSVPEQSLDCCVKYMSEQEVIGIDNLMVYVANKDVISPVLLVEKIYAVISSNNNSFWPLLGLELFNTITSSDTYIGSDVLNISPQILAYLRTKGNDVSKYLRDVMLRQLSAIVEKKNFRLPDSVSLNDEFNPTNEQTGFVELNAFFDSWIDEKKERLNFGDVFVCEGAYYLCISPLCDCAHSDGKEHFYFAAGKKIDSHDALKQKESGYVTYHSQDLILDWRPSTGEVYADSSYITPKPIFVNSTNIVNGNLSVQTYNRAQQSFVQKNFQYITTIKQNYAQRIANFAFTHSTRVGINFAFIDEENNNQGAEALDV